VEKITTRRREGVGVVVEKNDESRRTIDKNLCDLLTAIMHTEILVARCIFLLKSENVSDYGALRQQGLLTTTLVPIETEEKLTWTFKRK